MFYLVALAVGGLMEMPDFKYYDLDVIKADSPEEAKNIYNKKYNCSYFYGMIIAEDIKIVDEYKLSMIMNSKLFNDDLKNHISSNKTFLYVSYGYTVKDDFTCNGYINNIGLTSNYLDSIGKLLTNEDKIILVMNNYCKYFDAVMNHVNEQEGN